MHCGDEFRVRRGNADVVGGPDPVGTAQQVEIRERQIERHQGRPQRQPEETDQPWCQKQITRSAALPKRLSRQSSRLCWPCGADQRVRHYIYPRARMALLSAINCLAPSAGDSRPKPTCSLTRRSSVATSPAPFGGGGGKGPTLSLIKVM